MTRRDYYIIRNLWQAVATRTTQGTLPELLAYELNRCIESLVEYRSAFTTQPDAAAFFKQYGGLQVLLVKTYDASHDDLPGYVINILNS